MPNAAAPAETGAGDGPKRTEQQPHPLDAARFLSRLTMSWAFGLVRKGFFPAGSKVLYAHLGGAPALNGYSYIYRNG